jgi:hypothetical protein
MSGINTSRSDMPQGDSMDHDLIQFIKQDMDQMNSEYQRIHARATEDPGTAGDQIEGNWADFLRNWLPDSYHIRTKGRILGVSGEFSPQVDIVVLKPGYPSRLLEKNIYLADGVAAAFECKATLKANHIKRATRTNIAIQTLATKRSGTPYHELVSPIMYGILAHDHSWKGANATPSKNIERELEIMHKGIAHPSEAIDIVCVATLACWSFIKVTIMSGDMYASLGAPREAWEKAKETYGYLDDGCAGSHLYRDSAMGASYPISRALVHVIDRLAWGDSSLRPLADYYGIATRDGGESQGDRSSLSSRIWPLDVYTEDVKSGLNLGLFTNGIKWSEWGIFF